MALYTAEDIKAKILKIDEAIEATLEAQSYSKDSGQSNQSVTRANLLQLEKMRAIYIAQYDELMGAGGVNIINPQF